MNGGWLARTEIPPDGVQTNAFVELANKADADLRAIIDEVGSQAHRRGGSPQQQIADLYASMMDEARLEELGARAIQPVLDRIAAIDSASGMAAVAGYLSAIGAGGPFAGTVGFHPDERRGLVVQVARGGTLLPEVAQYLQSDAASAALRTEYAAYLRRVFTLVGRTDPLADAAAVIALETRLAAAQAETAADADDSRRRFALAELAVEMPGFDWRAWAKPQRLDRLAGVMLTPPAFFGRFAALVPDVPLETWKAWLTARYVTAASTFLSRPFDEARFEFFGRVLTGQQQPRPRWKRGVSLVNGYLGDALGRLYVERHFQPATRARVETIVINVREAFRRAIASADWMSTPTRRVALAKLATLSTKIGGPSQWRDYGGLDIRADDLIGNVQRAQAFENEYRMNVIARRAGRGDWPITPQTVNATYRPAVNEIVLPAAILKPPLFDAAADEAINYGSLGAILGHEIGHAFDGQGRRYDARGPSRDWWTSADDQRFSLLTRPLVEQYDALPAGGRSRRLRRAHAERERRRPRRPRHGVRGLPDRARRPDAGRRSTASPARSASSSAGRGPGAARFARRSCASGCSRRRTRCPRAASTARPLTSPRSTRRSARGRATGCTGAGDNACGSGERARRLQASGFSSGGRQPRSTGRQGRRRRSRLP